MKLFIVTADEGAEYGQFSRFVVVAVDEETARRTFPSTTLDYAWNDDRGCWQSPYIAEQPSSWPSDIDDVTVECIGTADERYVHTTVICSDFHAG